jgi:myo-inositol-1(or 4)-monophosphatase
MTKVSGWAKLLLVADRAVDTGARALRQGHSPIGASIGKGDRDFATDVDLRIESEVRAALAEATREVPFDGSPDDAESRYTIASTPSLVEPVQRIVVEAM